MQANSNPVNATGKKNVFCPYYKECLTYACKKYWKYWSCLDCEHKQRRRTITGNLMPQQSPDLYYTISPSLFLKDGEFCLD